jgi:prevent-host-death family protein
MTSARAPVSVHEAKTHLSKLLVRVEAGDEITITRGGTPVARLVPIVGSVTKDREPGHDAIVMAKDFDALPAAWRKAFGVR